MFITKRGYDIPLPRTCTSLQVLLLMNVVYDDGLQPHTHTHTHSLPSKYFNISTLYKYVRHHRGNLDQVNAYREK